MEGLPALSRLAAAGTDVSVDFTTEESCGAPVIVATRAVHVPDGLTPRQTEVCKLIATGLSNKEIARTLGISVATTKDHVHAILQRLGLKSRTAIVPYLHGYKASS